MSELKELLEAEAERRQPLDQPDFGELVAARRRRRGSAAVVFLAVVFVAGGAAFIRGGTPPGTVVRQPRPAGAPVTGILIRIGGPAGTPSLGVAGHVSFIPRGSMLPRAEITTGPDGHFTGAVPPGDYRIIGMTGADTAACAAPGPIVIPATGFDGIEVVCSVR
jgi:hypothetical protein